MDINRTAEILQELQAADNLRRLPEIEADGKYVVSGGRRYLNFSSNDYLGIAADSAARYGTDMESADGEENITGTETGEAGRSLYRDFMRGMAEEDGFMLSNPSSRLITGNSPDYRRLEDAISELYDGRPALVVGSGYLANTGVLPALTGKGDLILADKLVHASLIDGMRLCEADWKRFGHNDMEHLERLIVKHRNAYRDIWIVTESVFSMDGDRAPLQEIVALKQKYGLKIYVDEAHAFGVCGTHGRGVASALGCEAACDIIVATLGKAAASQGAFVLSDPLTRELLVNRMRTLIFSTALPPVSLRWSERVVGRLPQMEAQREHLNRLTGMLGSTSHIIPIMAGENSRAIAMSEQFREAGFWVMPIRYPTVPRGSARIRISLNAALSTGDIEQFIAAWKNIG